MPEFRGRGLGAGLLKAILEQASLLVEQVLLSVVAHNRSAISLYEQCGFVRYGLEPRALKTHGKYADELLMIRFFAADGT